MEINQVNNQVEYFTHANGARPYKVVIDNDTQVKVYSSSDYNQESYDKLAVTVSK